MKICGRRTSTTLKDVGRVGALAECDVVVSILDDKEDTMLHSPQP
jgi:hypothetical protein